MRTACWGPVIPEEKMLSLIDAAGYFYNFEAMPGFLARVSLRELEMEFGLDYRALQEVGRDK